MGDAEKYVGVTQFHYHKIDTMDESIAQLNSNIIKSGDVIKLELVATVLAGVTEGRAQGFFAFPFKLPNTNYLVSLSAISLGNIGPVSATIFYQTTNGVVLDVTSAGITNGSAYVISNIGEAKITITVN